jgi:hypothetical protein
MKNKKENVDFFPDSNTTEEKSLYLKMILISYDIKKGLSIKEDIDFYKANYLKFLNIEKKMIHKLKLIKTMYLNK